MEKLYYAIKVETIRDTTTITVKEGERIIAEESYPFKSKEVGRFLMRYASYLMGLCKSMEKKDWDNL